MIQLIGLMGGAICFAAGCGVDSPTASCNPNLYPYSEQSDDFSVANGAAKDTTAVKMFSPEQIPVKAAIAREFGASFAIVVGRLPS